MDEAITPKEFAKALRAMLEMHEQSYDERRMGYEVSWREAAEVTVPEEWRVIATCLGTAGFADIWDWCAEVHAKKGTGRAV